MQELLKVAKCQKASGKKNALYALGGVALVAAGVGLLWANPDVRRRFRKIRVASLLTPIFPDLARYMKMRAM
jgi:hypothetical protein